MSSAENTDPKVDKTNPTGEAPAAAAAVEATTATEEAKPSVTSSSVFSMFGGGAKKEKKDEDEDRGDNSGSAKAQREAAAAAKGDEVCLNVLPPFPFYLTVGWGVVDLGLPDAAVDSYLHMLTMTSLLGGGTRV